MLRHGKNITLKIASLPPVFGNYFTFPNYSAVFWIQDIHEVVRKDNFIGNTSQSENLYSRYHTKIIGK